MLSRQFLKVNGEKIRCFANSREAQARCCRIAVSEFTVIPPRTKIVVEGFPTSTIDRRATGLLETYSKFLHKKGLLVAKALVCPETGTVPVRIANLYHQKIELNKHTIVATFEPLEPEELLPLITTKTVSIVIAHTLRLIFLSICMTYILIVLSIYLSMRNPN